MKKTTLFATGSLLTLLPMTASAVTIAVDNNPTTGDLNLTALGSTDWMALGDGDESSSTTFVAQKSSVNFITTVQGVSFLKSDNNQAGSGWVSSDFNGAPWKRTWTDGDVASQTSFSGNLEAKSTNADDLVGLTFDIAGLSAGSYQLVVYGAAYSSDYSFSASLDNGGASDSVTGGSSSLQFTVDFTVTAGQTLTVDYFQTSDNATGHEHDNVSIQAITLAAVPEPSSTALLGLGGLALILRRRK
ncbi:PEP-CTERM sorting domain-containing protein [Rubritalea spongiae]|uniref:PEP-CTERM sorting domain-containing protein n=1 Tax=Rubritalea spongiae TaxID=430797 RepID=A0ABW5E4Z5_9BACT